jgi:hypothetical protein
MTAREFEEFVRTAWTTTNAALTDENLQRMSGLPRADVEHLARGLMRKGVVDMEVTSTGAIAWCVRGVARAPEATARPAASPPPPPPGPAPVATPLAVKAVSPPPIVGEVAKPVEVAKPAAKSGGPSREVFEKAVGLILEEHDRRAQAQQLRGPPPKRRRSDD